MQVNQSTRERRRELERATRHRNAGSTLQTWQCCTTNSAGQNHNPVVFHAAASFERAGERGVGGGGGSLYYNKITAIKQATRLNGNDSSL